jgi:hypothetical protein
MRKILRHASLQVAGVVIAAVGFAAVGHDSAAAASTDCASGYMCLWGSAAYSGTMKSFSTSGTLLTIGLSSVGSYYNHRTKRVWIQENADGSGNKLCVNPGVKVSLTAGWVTRAKTVYLSTIGYC